MAFAFDSKFRSGSYIVDFLCPSHRLIVEIDGGQHATQSLKDDRRTQWLESQRFTVLRFWNNDVSGNLDGVIETISRWLLSNPPPHPNRPLQGGGDSKVFDVQSFSPSTANSFLSVSASSW